MNRFVKKGCLHLLALTALLGVSSCSFFTDPDSGVTIKTVETSVLENGDTQVKIIYDNENKDPTVFVLSAANGIKEVTSVKEENGSTTITFKTSDGKSSSFTLPAVRSISYIEPVYNEDGSITLKIVYTDGSTENKLITLSKGDKGDPGKDGEDGRGIVSITSATQPDGSVKLTITYTDETTEDFLVPMGVGNVSTDYQTDEEGNLTVTITYSDGTHQDFTLNRQSCWFSGEGQPKNSLGQPGDYYFDRSKTGMAIYYKDETDSWKEIVSFAEQSNTTYTVSFELNADGDSSAQYLYDAESSYVIKKGQTFLSSKLSVPLASRDGYVFDGWYTASIVNPTTGKFTDLTTVWCDMTLHAHWVKN
ncbi:MAG TPA: hypothetical protein DEA63_03275 [Firmicutes bacterium]|nr:hypothetical protein [Bacillota bacterium]